MSKPNQFESYQKTNSGSLKVIFENVDDNHYRLRKDSLFQNPMNGPNHHKIEGEDQNHDLLGNKNDHTHLSSNGDHLH